MSNPSPYKYDPTISMYQNMITAQLQQYACDLRYEILNAPQTCAIIQPEYHCQDFKPKGLVNVYWEDEEVCSPTKTNCCNCGAPLYKNKCEYCGTINRG